MTSRLSWAALVGLVSVGTQGVGCGSTSTGSGACQTDKLPKTDPCYMKRCCDMVKLGPDGKVVADDAGVDAGPVTYRMCGACNG